MQPLDPAYFKGALETLDLVISLHLYFQRVHTLEKFSNTISQIEAKANTRVSTELKRILEIDIAALEPTGTDTMSSSFWQGVRDMARILSKRWTLGEQNGSSFQTMMVQIKEDLRKKMPNGATTPLEEILDELGAGKDPSLATPYIYNPPYPKPPPEGMAEAHEKPKIPTIVEGSPDDFSPENGISNDASQPLATRILDKTEENDEILSQSLRDALRILRDED